MLFVALSKSDEPLNVAKYKSNGDFIFINGLASYFDKKYADAVDSFGAFLAWLPENNNENVYAKCLAYVYKLCAVYEHNKSLRTQIDDIRDNIEKFLELKEALKKSSLEFYPIVAEFIDAPLYDKVKAYKKELVQTYAAYVYFDNEMYAQCKANLAPIVDSNPSSHDDLQLKYLICSYKLLVADPSSSKAYEAILKELDSISYGKDEAKYHMAQIYMLMREYVKAHECIDKSMKIAAKRGRKQFNDRLYVKGRVYYEQENLEQALDCFTRQTIEFPQHFDAHAYIALCYDRKPALKKVDDAQLLRIYDKAMFGSEHDKWLQKRADLYQRLLRERVKKAGDAGYPTMVFISYNWTYQAKVKSFQNILTQMGFKCWFDIRDNGLKVGGETTFCHILFRILGIEMVKHCRKNRSRSMIDQGQ